MKLPELKSLMREHNIKGSSCMNKPEIIALLADRGIISEDSVKKRNSPIKREIDTKYDFTKSIRNNPKSVEIRDLDTSETTIYSSIYKASRAIGHGTKVITSNNGKVWRDRYEINIIGA